MLTNLNLPQGYIGPGTYSYPVSGNPGGALIFVSSVNGLDSRSRLANLSNPASAALNISPFGDPNQPLATIFGANGALSYVKAGRGDVIVALPTHAETLAASAVVPAGVTILGIGYGNSRPTVTYSAVASNILMSGAGSQLNNLCLFGTGIDAITSLVTVSGASCQIVNNKLLLGDATNQGLTAVTVSGNDCLIGNNDIISLTAGAAQGVISSAAIARLFIINNYIRGNFSAANLKSASTNHITDMLVAGNTLVQLNGTAKAVIDFTTSSTGMVRNNSFAGTTWAVIGDAIANSSSVLLRWFENYGMDDATGAVSGILCPAAGTIT